SAPPRVDNLYFLPEHSSPGAPGSVPSSPSAQGGFEQPPAAYSGAAAASPGAPAASPGATGASPGSPAGYPNAPATYPSAPAAYPSAPHSYPNAPANAGAALGEAFVIPTPSQSDPHRLSDAAALASPPAPAPGFEGVDSTLSPGAAGPAASDALYFTTHGGGHPGLVETAPAQPKQPAPGYSPQLAESAPSAPEPFDPYRV